MSSNPFPYKAICSDLDLTLLHSDASISQPAVRLLNRALARGIKVCLVSARHPLGITLYQPYFNQPLPYVAYNGGLAVTEEGRELYNYTIPAPKARQIWEAALASGIPGTMMVYAQANWYAQAADKENPYLLKEENYMGLQPILADFKELFQAGLQPNKFLFSSDPSASLAIEKVLLEHAGQLHVCRSSQWSVDVMPHGIDKALGVKAMARHWGLRLEEILAFGDSANDLEMLRSVGWGVAVANAAPEVAAAANDHTLSNNQDGVARYLERWEL